MHARGPCAQMAVEEAQRGTRQIDGQAELCLRTGSGMLGKIRALLRCRDASGPALELPPLMQAKNSKGMPTHILLVQGLIVTVISCPSQNAGQLSGDARRFRTTLYR